MDYNSRFLRYLFKKYYKMILVILGLGFLIFPLPAMINPLHVDQNGVVYNYTESFLYLGTIFACAAAMILPIVIRSVFLNRKKCDRLLSLPLSANRIWLLTSAFAYLAFLACFTVLYHWNVLTLAHVPVRYPGRHPGR